MESQDIEGNKQKESKACKHHDGLLSTRVLTSKYTTMQCENETLPIKKIRIIQNRSDTLRCTLRTNSLYIYIDISV